MKKPNSTTTIQQHNPLGVLNQGVMLLYCRCCDAVGTVVVQIELCEHWH